MALSAREESLSSNSRTKSSLSFKTLLPELSSHQLSATNHKSTKGVPQMLKWLKECLHQQKNTVIYKLGVSGNIQLIAFWTCVSRIWKPEAVLVSNERETKRKYLQACMYQRLHFSPFVGSCDAVCMEMKPSYSSTTKPFRKPGQEIRKVLFPTFKLHEAKDHHCYCTRQATRINTCEDHAVSPLWAEWANIPSGKIWSRPQPAVLCSTNKHISQIWTEDFT